MPGGRREVRIKASEWPQYRARATRGACAPATPTPSPTSRPPATPTPSPTSRPPAPDPALPALPAVAPGPPDAPAPDSAVLAVDSAFPAVQAVDSALPDAPAPDPAPDPALPAVSLPVTGGGSGPAPRALAAWLLLLLPATARAARRR